MPHYKLTYFHLRGRAEYIRIAFTVAGVEFEDVRVKSLEEWLTKLKPSRISPSGQLPILQIDDKVLCQSKVILSFVAKEHGLAPEDNFHQAQADMLANTITEMEDQLGAAFWEAVPEKKKEMFEKFENQEIPEKCEFFQKFLGTNEGKAEYLVGNKLTYADIVVFTFLNSYMAKGKPEGVPGQLNDYSALSAWYNRIRTQPKIQEWLKSAPEDLIDYIY